MSLLRELKTILEHEQRVGGSFPPLPCSAGQEAKETAAGGHAVAEPAPQPSEAAPANKVAPPANADSNLFGGGAAQGGGSDLSPYARIHALIPAQSPLRDMNTLDEVEAFVRDNALIPLDKTRKNPVFGVGNAEADLMVIGEAPGADEDARGEPFVGRAGQLLNKILKAIDFEREEVYIANILKSRPPNNRNPLAGEIQAHAPILYKQMTLVRPRLLLCLGRVAASALLERQDSLKAMREKFQNFHGLPLLVTYHPAALLRNPGWKRAAWEDVQMLRKRYNQLTGPDA